MKSAPLVSCIIPVFNGERYLTETLESVLKQTYESIEIIVINDGSTDRTPEILKKFSKKITSFHQANSGPAAARNLGLCNAKGDKISFLDADDLWHPEKIKTQLEFLRTHSELDICFTLIRNFWSPDSREEEERSKSAGKVKLCFPFSPCSFLGKREVFDQIGKFREDLKTGEDTDIFLRMKNGGIHFDVVPKVLVFRRLHQDNLTRGLYFASKAEMQQRALKALRNFRQKDKN